MSGSTLAERFECVIGLEVHLQLSTQSKLFCGCPTAYGAEPNTHVCPVCTGQPGVLPVLNPEAVRLALRFGAATGAQANTVSVFARKNYFYPDLPKGYQITQYRKPLLTGGAVPFDAPQGGRTLELERAHLEEDAGKSLHPEFGGGSTRVDFNRAGTPLLEVVSRPMLHDPRHASLALQRIRQIGVYLGICDGNMEEGSLRCDANISVRPRGQEALNPKTEVKNLNSFRHVEHALRWEWERQARLLEDGETLEQATRLWDEKDQRTRLMRTKEDAEDYRYFPEPDLPPLDLGTLEKETGLPPLPWEKESEYAQAGVSPGDARTLAADPALGRYYEGVAAATGNPKAAANWVLSEVLRHVREAGTGPEDLRAGPEDVGELIRLLDSGTITRLAAKEILAIMVRTGDAPGKIIKRENLGVIEDPIELRGLIKEAVDNHPDQAAKYLSGKDSLIQFFLGQVMRATRGRANPSVTQDLIRAHLEGMRES